MMCSPVMVLRKCVPGWLLVVLATTTGCPADPCEEAAPTVHLDLVLSNVSPGEVRSLEILLDSGDDHYRRIYNIDGQLADGRTSLSIQIDPAPTQRFEVGFDVRAFDAPDGGGSLVGARAFVIEAEPNGCNDAEVKIARASEAMDSGVPQKDAGEEGMDAGSIVDAEPMDGEAVDAEARDAEPQVDAEPIDAEPMDAEPMDAPAPDAIVVDTGVDAGCPDDDNDGVCNPDDNCPQVPNPQQQDRDGVKAYPIAYAPISLVNGNVDPTLVGDDAVGDPIQIGFTFFFFGAPRNEIYPTTNGFFSFAPGQGDGCCTGQNIPDSSTPNNLVALAWYDLEVVDPFMVTSDTLGTAPNRMFVIQYDAVFVCCGPTNPTVTVQAILYEGSNVIEIHTTEQPDENGFTRGIEGPGGGEGAHLPGEADDIFLLNNDSVGFTTDPLPDGVGDACSNAF